MRLVLASNNRGKLDELQDLFAPLGVQLIAQGSLGVPESPEPYRTFVEKRWPRRAMRRSTPA